MLKDIEAIRYLIAKYCHSIDDGDHVDVADLFAEDGVWKVGKVTYQGRSEILELLTARGRGPDDPPQKHLSFNSAIDVDIEGKVASALTDYVVVREAPDGGFNVEMCGRYQDLLVKGHDGRWRLASRTSRKMAGISAAGG